MHADRLEGRVGEREELWKAIEGLRLAEPSDITGFTEIDRAHLTFGSGLPLGAFGTCVEASWHGSRVSVKQLLAPTSAPSRPGGRNGGGGGGGGGWTKAGGGGGGGSRTLSTAAASAMRRQIRLLQALHFEFLVPIYGACTAPPNGVSLVFDNLRLMVSDYGLLSVKAENNNNNKNHARVGGNGPKHHQLPPAGFSSPMAAAAAAAAVAAGVDGSAAPPVVSSGGSGEECWTAPEVCIDGEGHSYESDVFSYGGVLYELLAEELLQAAPGGTPPPAMQRQPGVSMSANGGGSSPSSLQERLRGEHGGASAAAAAAAAGWVPRVPARVDAHPGQVQLMQRCLRHERELRPGGFYPIVLFLHDLVKSLGGDERRKNALWLGPTTNSDTPLSCSSLAPRGGRGLGSAAAAAAGPQGGGGGDGVESGRQERDWSAQERQ
ncbi:unnamed protein product, partial [Ectocarpus fasciculatus]